MMRISDKDLKKLLLASGQVKMDALEEAARAATQSGEPLLSVIIKRKLIGEKELAELYGKSIGVPFAGLKEAKIPRETLTKIPERIAREYQVVLFGQKDGRNLLAMADPEDLQALDYLKKQLGGNIEVYISTSSDIMAVLDQYKGNIDTEITKAIKDSSVEEEADQPQVDASDLAEDAPIAKTVNIILEFAVKSRASDVHIEPRENTVQVRYRVDGVLQESMTLPKPLMAALVSRIKILANLKIDEHRIPQDGRFKFTVGSRTVALRVSTLPIMDGEKVVMRLLDESSKPLTLEELGFEGRGLEIIKRNLTKPHGMTLVTGPTGSGKSTTLYSVLNLLNTPRVNISTVEDPVEYRIQGVNQTQVNPKVGMTFAGGLRALLRQDPNIIMVGEIRDSETADLAVQAALTGHVVLSTLHTNNAATTLPRLLEMKIEPFLIASTVNTVVGQRLVRRLCEKCKEPFVPNEQEVADLKKEFQVEHALEYFEKNRANPAIAASAPPAEAVEEAAKDDKGGEKRKKEKVIKPIHEDLTEKDNILKKIMSDPNIINRSADDAKKAEIAAKAGTATKTKDRPKGIDQKELKKGEFLLYRVPEEPCEDCKNGYTGRMGIYEILEVTEEIGKLIVSHATSEEIQHAAVSDGMLTMQQDGFVKALRGLTTVEEVLRVTRE